MRIRTALLGISGVHVTPFYAMTPQEAPAKRTGAA
jgi:hypothetical protein